MTRTLSLVVRCLYLCLLGCLLFPFALQADEVNVIIPTSYLPNDTLFFVLTDCQSEIEICIEDLSLVELSNLSISVNEAAYQGSFEGCNLDTTSAYTYSTLFGAGESGPYELLVWRVGDAVFSGVFNTIPDLVDSMNLWDPLGNWVLNDTTQFIVGGQSGISYSDMSVQVISINLPSFIGYNFGVEANGVQLSFGEGIHRVTIEDTVNNTIRKAVVVVACPTKTVVERHILLNETMQYCMDFSGLLTDVQTVTFCDIPNEDKVLFELIEDSCVSFTGIEVGFDTACILACDVFGYCDTTILYINVHPTPTVSTINITMNLGDSLNICPDEAELAGIVTGIDDFCKNNSTETIISNINNVDLCFRTTATKLGTDSICAVICDNLLICDTTYYLFTVVSTTTPSLTATPDSDTTSTNSLITINVLENDSIPDGVITDMEILSPNGLPTNGIATIRPDGAVDYTPNLDFCGDSDTFQYRICNDGGCDTTEVAVFVTCPDPLTRSLTIYTGFSPNGDGINDFFRIEGIAQYPNNEVSIFNRWGTKVFNQLGYKNAWDGTWNNKTLPDGTYFYILKDGEGKKYSGYIQINL